MRKFIAVSATALMLSAGFYGVSLAQTEDQPDNITVVVKANPRPPVEAFARLPAKSAVAISPQGKHLAWIEGNTVVTYDMDTGEQSALGGGSNKPLNLRWASEDRLLVSIATQTDYQKILTIEFSTYLVLDAKAKYIGPLFEAKEKGKPSPSGPILRIVQGENPYALIIGQDGNNSSRLSSSNDEAYIPVIYKVDIKTGKRTVYEKGTNNTSTWSLDKDNVPRVRVEYLNGEINYGARRVNAYVKKKPNGAYELLDIPEKTDVRFSSFAYSQTDNGVFWRENNKKTNVTEVYFYSFDTGKTSLYKSAEGQEFAVTIREKDSKRVGESDYQGQEKYIWTDPQYKADYATLDKLFPDKKVLISSRTEDENLLVVNVSSEDQPSIYYLYDRAAKTIDMIGESYPELVGAPLGKTEFATYKASDGLEIPVYITKRPDLKLPAPTVFVVHGGPAGNDKIGFDFWVQFLANRGYVVVQPQYRGSTGFGEAFQKAGDKQWGRKMNSDLVDGVDYLVKAGISDAKKVCVSGWSYGGYATMAAVTLTPEVWACGIEGAGVSDPIRMINWVYKDREQAYGDSGGETGTNYWKSVIGDPRTEGAAIREISPVEHVNNLKVPLLLFHGDKDIRVPKEQSELMWAAMQKAGKAGKLVILPNETHHIILYESRFVFLSEMEAFLKEHNPSDYNHN